MISVSNLSVTAGTFRLKDVSFEVPTGQYAALMGKTGSGKTTLLEALCGLRSIHDGRIVLHGRDVTHRKPAERDIGYVPQDGALFMTMSVRDNLAFALEIRHLPRSVVTKRVQELVDLLGIGNLLDRNPRGLSGGEKQRVALGRALAARPSVLCLDEPLSALDDDTRHGMYELLKLVKTQTGVTTLHITHSHQEAAVLADTTLVMQKGQVVQQSVTS